MNNFGMLKKKKFLTLLLSKESKENTITLNTSLELALFLIKYAFLTNSDITSETILKRQNPSHGELFFKNSNGARYLDPKYSRWISVDPALGEYVPSAGKSNEADKLPGMGGIFNSVNLSLYHYAGNNPVKYIDPDGRELRAEKLIKAITDSFESDDFGKELLHHYLHGNGVTKICNSEEWQNYMRSNDKLRLDIGSEILDHFNKEAGNFDENLTFSFRFHGEMQNSEKIEGYSYLHGSNADEGDVSVFVYAEKNSDETVTFSYSVTWNDRIDVNGQYITDILKNKFAKILSSGRYKDYRIEIFWNDKLTIGNNGFKFGE